MYFSLRQQIVALSGAFLLGIVLGLLLELFRLWRRFSPHRWVDFIRDGLFIIGSVLLSAVYYIYFCRGEVRWFYLLSQLLGMVLFHRLIGRFLYEGLYWLLRVLFGTLKRVLAWAWWPFGWLLGHVWRFLQKVVNIIFKKLFIFIKKYIIIKIYPLFVRKPKSRKGDTLHGQKEQSFSQGHSQFYH